MALFIKVCIVVFLMFAIVKSYQRAKDIQKKHTINLAVFSKIWLFFAAILIVGYLVSAFLMAGTEIIIIDIILLALIAFLCISSVICCRWHIDSDDEGIRYCSFLGKSRYCYYDQIERVEVDEKGKVCIYFKNKDVLKIKIKSEIRDTYLIMQLRCHDINVEYKYKMNDFIMQLPLFYPAMHLCFFVIAVFLTVLEMKYIVLAGLFFGALALGSLYNGVSAFKDKVIVKGNMIVQTRFLRKTRKIEYGQVDKVIRKTRDNAPYLYFYSDKGLVMKINMLCDNKELLEKLVKTHHWER